MSPARFLAAFVALQSCIATAASDSQSQFKEFKVHEPKIPKASATITEFGAVPDGKTLNTDAIAKGIASIAAKGGGKLIIPAGMWLTGPIQLTNHLELCLERGAFIQFTSDLKQYPQHSFHLKDQIETTATPPIYGENLHDIAITGEGVIDGNGQVWRPVKKSKMTTAQWSKLLASGGKVVNNGEMWWPSEEAMQDHRPRLMRLVNCTRVLLEGVTFQNSPSWNLNPVLCEDVTARNITVRNPWYSQNGDGLDLEYCRNVVIRESRFDVGDDAICLKSGANERGRRIGVPTENVLVENCVVYHGHGGVTIGSEMSSGVRNVRVDNCVFIGTDLGLRFKSTRGRGGVVENIFISNVRMTDIATDAIGFNMYYGGQSPTEEGADAASSSSTGERQSIAVSEGTPQFRNIYIENVVCRGARQAIALQGLPEMPIRDIHLRNVSITAERGIDCTDAQQIHFQNVEVLNDTGAVIALRNSRDIRIDNLGFANGADALVKAQGRGTAGISIRNTNIKAARKDFDLAEDVSRDAFRVE